MPLPWMHFSRPRSRSTSSCDHQRTRAISGSPAITSGRLHCRGRIEHRLVHVDVDDLGTVFHLLARDRSDLRSAFEIIFAKRASP